MIRRLGRTPRGEFSASHEMEAEGPARAEDHQRDDFSARVINTHESRGELYIITETPSVHKPTEKFNELVNGC